VSAGLTTKDYSWHIMNHGKILVIEKESFINDL
jgi:hypothetical protein